MQITCTRIPETNDFTLVVKDQGSTFQARVPSTQLKTVVVALQSVAPPNNVEKQSVANWFNRIP
jgi:hypothetical protein